MRSTLAVSRRVPKEGWAKSSTRKGLGLEDLSLRDAGMEMGGRLAWGGGWGVVVPASCLSRWEFLSGQFHPHPSRDSPELCCPRSGQGWEETIHRFRDHSISDGLCVGPVLRWIA